MATLWVFGDSFCVSNKNWIKTLADKGNLTVAMRSRPASSIFFTYRELLRNIEFFQPEDSIVVGLTIYSRHLFNDNHFLIQDYTNEDEPSFFYSERIASKDTLDAYKNFLKYLYNSEEEKLKALAMVEVIINNIPTRIQVKNYIPFFTINGKRDFGLYKHLNFDFNKYPSFWDTSVNFLVEKNEVEKADIKKIVEITDTPNHWIDHPEWDEYFWNTYNDLFKPILDG